MGRRLTRYLIRKKRWEFFFFLCDVWCIHFFITAGFFSIRALCASGFWQLCFRATCMAQIGCRCKTRSHGLSFLHSSDGASPSDPDTTPCQAPTFPQFRPLLSGPTSAVRPRSPIYPVVFLYNDSPVGSLMSLLKRCPPGLVNSIQLSSVSWPYLSVSCEDDSSHLCSLVAHASSLVRIYIWPWFLILYSVYIALKVISSHAMLWPSEQHESPQIGAIHSITKSLPHCEIVNSCLLTL